MINRIAKLDPDTYTAFCRWLRESQGTTIGELVKESGVSQDRAVTKFLIDTGRTKSESYFNSI